MIFTPTIFLMTWFTLCTVKNKKKQKNKKQNVGLIIPRVFHYTRPVRNAYPRIARQLVGMITVLCWGVAATANERAATYKSYHFDMPALVMHDALDRVAKKTGNQLLVSSELVETLTSSPVQGQYTVLGALNVLLKGTDLSGSLTEHGVIVVRYPKPDPKTNGDDTVNKMNAKKNILASTIAFFVGGSGVAAQAEDEGKGWVLEEIVVTAQKRETSLQDTAMAISAVSGEMIDKKGLVSMDDYLRNIPGVSMQERGAGQNSIVIRGMATSPQGDDSTAGAYFGETPISNIRSASQTGSAGNADIKLIDIERVEVLRGPQGTLYGSGSMAGTVRIIPNSPKLDKVGGSVATRLSNTSEAGGDNTSVQAVLNIPLIEDKLAVRGVVYRVDNSGFIDNVAGSQPTSEITDMVDNSGAVALDKDDRGSDTTTGFRLAALWQITDQFDATLSYIAQDIEQDGQPEVNLEADGKYQQQRLQIGRGQNEDELIEVDLDLVNLVLSYDLGWGELMSSSSWLENDASTRTDVSSWSGGPYFNNNVAPFESFTEELRFSSLWEGPTQLVAGVYYEDREEELHTFLQWVGDQSMDPYPPSGISRSQLDRVRNIKQKAVFGELSYSLSDQWEATVGARHFDYEIKEVSSLDSRGANLWTNRRLLTDETGQVYKGALSYTPTEDLLVYGQWAQGFRVGRAQVQSNTCTDAGIEVPGVDSDTSETIELGIKSSWMDNRVTFNAAIYQTNWDDIPVRLRTPAPLGGLCSRLVNAGKAQSEGVEIELQALLADNLQVNLSVSTVDATLEETSSIGNKGDDLPGSADYNVNVGLEYGFTLASYSSFARVDYAYVGEYYNNLEQTGTEAGDFGQVHAKVGVNIGAVDLDLFVKNLTNDDGLTWVEETLVRFSGGTDQRAYRIRPRTIGMNISYRF